MLTKNEKFVVGTLLGAITSINAFYLTVISSYNYMLQELGVTNVTEFVFARIPTLFFGEIIIIVCIIALFLFYVFWVRK